MRFLIRDLQPGSNYSVQLRFNDGDAVSDWSRKFSLAIPANNVPPEAPTGFTWVVSGDSFHGEWNPVSTRTDGKAANVIGYEVEMTANSTVRVDSVSQSTQTVKYDLLFDRNRALFGSPQPVVSARVRAIASGNLKGAWTAPISATNPRPGDVTLAAPLETVDGVKLSWTAPTDTDLIGYRVYAGTSANPTSMVWQGSSTNYTYTTLTYQLHYFKVVAVDKFNQESIGVTATGTPKTPFLIDVNPPGAPTNFAVAITDDPAGLLLTQQANATWSWDNTDTGLTGFNIRYKRSGTTAWTTIAVPPDPQQPYLITRGLTANVPYDFEIRSLDISGNKSSWVGLSTNAVNPTVVPTLANAIKVAGGGYIESADYSNGVGYRIDEDSITIINGAINGQAITSGIIRSNQPAIDVNGDVIPGEYAWQIDLEGDAVLGNVKVRGSMVVGQTGETQISRIQSYNYSPASSGYAFFSDGSADLRSIGADAISVESLASGTLDSIIELQGSLEAYGEMGEVVSMGADGFRVIGPSEIRVTNKSLTSNVARLITAEAHNFAVGAKIVVSGVGEPFDGTYVLDSAPSPNVIQYAVTGTDLGSTTSVGSVRGKSTVEGAVGPTYVNFPTDGSQPNIISGTTTANSLVVTKGASFRGTSGIETNAVLTIASNVVAPKSEPQVQSTYRSRTLKDVPGKSIGGIEVMPSGTLAVASYSYISGSGYATFISEHNASTGAFIRTITTVQATGSSYVPLSLTHGRTTAAGSYYLTLNYTDNVGVSKYQVYQYTSTWTLNSILNPTVPFSGSTYGVVGGWDYTNSRFIIGSTESSNLVITHYPANNSTGVLSANTLTTFLPYGGSGRGLGYIARGTFSSTYSSDRYVFKTKTGAGGANEVYNLWLVTATATNSARNIYESWPVAYDSSIVSGYWDGNNWFDVTSDKTIRTYEKGEAYWTNEGPYGTKYFGYSWYDSKIAGTGVHETNLSPMIASRVRKRAAWNVTVSPIPYTADDDSPDQAIVYIGKGSINSPSWRKAGAILYPSTTLFINPDTTSTGTPQTTNQFTSSSLTPGLITSTSGLSFWGGDDRAQFKSLLLVASNDVNASYSNLPSLRVRSAADTQEIRIDGNEIQAVLLDHGTQTAYTNGLSLQASGGNLNFNGADQVSMGGKTLKKWNWGTYNNNVPANAIVTITHGLGISPDVIFVSARATETSSPQFVAYDVTSTQFKVRVKAGDGSDYTGGGFRAFDWLAIA